MTVENPGYPKTPGMNAAVKIVIDALDREERSAQKRKNERIRAAKAMDVGNVILSLPIGNRDRLRGISPELDAALDRL